LEIRAMRVLMLTQFYPPFIGGEERHVHTLSTRLAARGHDVAVATIGGPDMPAFAEEQGVRVYRLRGTMQRASWLFSDGARRHVPPFPDPELGLALRRIIARERPEIVHAHNWMLHSFLPLKPWSGAKLVLTMHDHSLRCPKKKLIRGDEHCVSPTLADCVRCAGAHYGAKGLPVLALHRAMGAAVRAAVDMYLPVSRAVADDNELLGGSLPVQVIPNFVPDDVADLPATPHPLLAQLPEGEFMLFVGAFGRYKGLDVLLEAYRQMPGAPPLVIIGYQTPEYPIRTTTFPPNVLVLRDWPHAAVMQAWARAMLGLVPSTWSDPCPTVAMEAMALGRPLIATRIGGLTDLVDDGETGLLVPPRDPAALRSAMERLVADPAARERMGASGRRKVAGFQAGSVVARIERVYRELTQVA
jgi:glycosyltransferase involved in cell wall biosynthesis